MAGTSSSTCSYCSIDESCQENSDDNSLSGDGEEASFTCLLIPAFIEFVRRDTIGSGDQAAVVLAKYGCSWKGNLQSTGDNQEDIVPSSWSGNSTSDLDGRS